ncbi:MAG: hypothetical protein P4L92_00155 [Rudaea sp.]|nr:hypothetical protein [Rudaea sp.]
MTPEEFRPILFELLYALQRATRYYRGKIVHTPPEQEYPGWGTLYSLTDRATTETRRILDQSSSLPHHECELTPPNLAMARDLAAKIRMRRAHDASRRRASGLGLH